MKVDETTNLEVEVTPPESQVTYKSLQDNIASVTPDGQVQGLQEGVATITATVGDVTDRVTVNVSPKDVE